MDVRITNPRVKRLVRKELADGRYESETALVEAALAHFIPHQRFGAFSAGELDRVIEASEQSGAAQPAEQVFAEVRGSGKRLRKAK